MRFHRTMPSSLPARDSPASMPMPLQLSVHWPEPSMPIGCGAWTWLSTRRVNRHKRWLKSFLKVKGQRSRVKS